MTRPGGGQPGAGPPGGSPGVGSSGGSPGAGSPTAGSLGARSAGVGSSGDADVASLGDAAAAVRTAAEHLFRDRLALAERYAEMLATDGVLRGLIGPREAPRLWERHLLNSAVVAELVPDGASVIDVGSGAGLPGVPLALAQPSLRLTLVEPMARRVDFLTEVVAALALDGRVTVVRARAEELTGRLPLADGVVARALAPLDRLARWCLPLATVEGRVWALKGASAAAEISAHAAALRRLGGGPPKLRRCGVGLVEPPTSVVEIIRRR